MLVVCHKLRDGPATIVGLPATETAKTRLSLKLRYYLLVSPDSYLNFKVDIMSDEQCLASSIGNRYKPAHMVCASQRAFKGW